MAIAFKNKGARAELAPASGSSSITPALPASTVAGDFLVAHITHATTTTCPTPSGWTLGISVTVGTYRTHFFYKWAEAGETATTFATTGGANGNWGVISSYTGVPVRANPFNVAPVAGASTFASPNQQGPSMTSTVAGAMAVWLWTTSDNSTTGAAGGGATAAYSGSSYDSTVGLDASHFSAYLLKTSAGATGTVTIAASSGASTAVIRFMLDPTPAGSAPTVNAGADATITLGASFTRTATEDNGGMTITARSWRITSGPAGVGTTIGTAATLSAWTPSVAGTYTLEYSATNSIGTDTDAMILTVNPPAPIVNAGADISVSIGTTVTRTASESGGAPSSRAWTILSGPTGVGTTIGTAAALSWTPSVYGQYVLRYTATNVTGSGTDDVAVLVAAKMTGASTVANGYLTSSGLKRVRKAIAGAGTAHGNIPTTVKLRRAARQDAPAIITADVSMSAVKLLKIRKIAGTPSAHGSVIAPSRLRIVDQMHAGTLTANGICIKAALTRTRMSRFNADFTATGTLRRITQNDGSGTAHVTAQGQPHRVVLNDGLVTAHMTAQPLMLRRKQFMYADTLHVQTTLQSAYLDRVFVFKNKKATGHGNITPRKIRRVTKTRNAKARGTFSARERAARVVIPTAILIGSSPKNKGKSVHKVRGYTTAIFEAFADIKLGEPRHLAQADATATGDLTRLRVFSKTVTAKFSVSARLKVIGVLTDIIRVIDDQELVEHGYMITQVPIEAPIPPDEPEEP